MPPKRGSLRRVKLAAVPHLSLFDLPEVESFCKEQVGRTHAQRPQNSELLSEAKLAAVPHLSLFKFLKLNHFVKNE